MPRKYNQKLKILLIRDYFYRFSDEEHPITVPMIIKMLNDSGITSERKSIYNDIKTLQDDYDFDIICAERGKYFLGSREFEFPEVKLLVDTVSSSKFLTEKKSESLIKKIECLCSEYQAGTLSRQAFLQTRIKNMNESIFNTVDIISSAMDADLQISFKYFHCDENKKEIYSKSGEKYTVSPYAMLIDGDNYYLVSYDSENDIIRHFRADRIKQVGITKSKREGHNCFKKENYKSLSGRVFSMFGGDVQNVTLRFDNSLAGVVIDRFGKDVMFIKHDENCFDMRADIEISPQFFGWIFGLQSAKIISPKEVVDEYKDYLTKQLEKY